MAFKIALVNEKGGVGKTTIAVHLAGWLKEQGIDVALVDSDVQSGSSIWASELGLDLPIHRFLTDDEILNEIPNLANQVVVIDGPGGFNQATRSALLLADLALIPCGPSILDVRASGQGIQALNQARTIRGGAPEAFFVPNKLQRNYRLSRDLLEVADELGLKVAPGLGLRQAYARAPEEGKLVWELGRPGDDASIEIRKLFNFIKDYVGQKTPTR